MFHSVGNVNNNWYRNWLSVSLPHFEHFCKFLVRSQYNTIHLDEWYYLQDHPVENDKKIIALTFDDGYLDNWVYVYPVLKKYNLKGTIFVNPEFIDPSTGIRPNLDDVWANKILRDELNTLGFLNWSEIQKMDASGFIDIQSHSMSHNFYFHSNKIIDVYNKQPEYDWLAWFLKPERKPFYITEDQSGFVQVGYPVFEYGRALGLRRYFPDELMIEYSTNLFNSNGGKKDKNKQLNILNEKINQLPGHFETEKEMEARYRYELFDSKKILEEKLGKKKNFLCWPGGGYNLMSVEMSINAGYKASMISSRDRNVNNIDNNGTYKRIARFGMGSFITIRGHRYLVKDNNWLIHNYKSRTGSSFYLNINRGRKFWYMLKNKLTV